MVIRDTPGRRISNQVEKNMWSGRGRELKGVEGLERHLVRLVNFRWQRE